MTKEEILKSTHAKNVMNWEKVFRQNPLIIESAYESMDLYAKQETEALTTTLCNLIESIPSQTNDRDWWPDELSKAVMEAEKVMDGNFPQGYKIPPLLF